MKLLVSKRMKVSRSKCRNVISGRVSISRVQFKKLIGKKVLIKVFN